MGSRGGPTRMLILMRLRDGPANAHQLATSLRLNYKTIQYHLETLLENKLVDREEYGYGAKYRLSQLTLENLDILDSIIEEIFGQEVKAGKQWARSG
jgi:DNA-binding transcriptional ArsR family regulator